jgi:hypothetical protein
METPAQEAMRRELIQEINSNAETRAELEKVYGGQVWDTEELSRDFIVEGFLAPFVRVTRKRDGVKGTLLFQHHPRFYFSFQH